MRTDFNAVLKGFSARPGMYTAGSGIDSLLAFVDGLTVMANVADVAQFEDWLRNRYHIEGRALGLSGLLRFIVEQRAGEMSAGVSEQHLFQIISHYLSDPMTR